jgi:hypothetical protein
MDAGLSHITQKIKGNKTMMLATGAVLAAGFLTMVTSAYSADHIQKSKCEMKTDQNLTNAYKWSLGTAVAGGVVTAIALGSIVVVLKK